MSIIPAHGPEGQSRRMTAIPDAVFHASHGSPESRYLGGPGKPMSRQVTDLQDRGPAAARILEGIFVTVLTVLRYDSLHIQGAGVLTAAGAAALAALISALGLLGIEEIVVETRTFGIFLSTLRVSWKRWRYAAATARLARIQARIKAAAGKLQQHFLDFLLKTEGLPLDDARRRAADFKAALTDREI